MGFGYRRPETVTAAIAEISTHNSAITEYFGNSVHLFLLPIKGVKFAAMIPKGTYVTVCILGKDIVVNTVNNFLDNRVVKSILPKTETYKVNCRCLPKMNVRAPKIPFNHRVILCGDAGSTRLFKDGLGAAYIMGKAAAKTAVFHGVSKQHFQKEYYPVYRNIIIDNKFGKVLFAVTDAFKVHKALNKSMFRVVQKEQLEPSSQKILSSVLWDMFTGNELYKDIFRRAMNFPMFFDIFKGCIRI